MINKNIKIGEKAIYKSEVAEVWGIDQETGFAAIKIRRKDYNEMKLVDTLSLHKYKNREELKKGDKFITTSGFKYKILAAAKDEVENEIYYFSRRIKNPYKGRILTILPDEIEEVIYD